MFRKPAILRFICAFALLLLSTSPLMAVAHKIFCYNLSVSARYPMPNAGRYESYALLSGKKTHTLVERKGEKEKSKRLKSYREIEAAILYLDSLFRLQTIQLQAPEGFADSLRTRTDKKQRYKVSDTDIAQFFEKESLTLHTGDIRQRDFSLVPNDGVSYTFRLEVKTAQSDTSRHIFHGYFMDYISERNIKYWLPVYMTCRKFRLFESFPEVNPYFGDRNLEDVLLRFIAWQK